MLPHENADHGISLPLTLLRLTRQTQRMFNYVLGSIGGISLLGNFSVKRLNVWGTCCDGSVDRFPSAI